MRKRILIGLGCVALAMSGTSVAQRRGGDGEIGAKLGQFGGGEQRPISKSRKLQAEQYRQIAERQRAEANGGAHIAQRAPLSPENGRIIREALKYDMNAWRKNFQVGRADWQAMSKQWLPDFETLTPQQWAHQRARWFSARDAWISQRGGWTSAQRR